MFFLLGIWNGLGEIRAHKLRSLLTVTCVMLGVASLVLIAGFISGLFRTFEVYQQEMGWAQSLEVTPTDPPDSQKNLKAMSPGLTLADAQSIAKWSRYAVAVAPKVQAGRSISYRGTSPTSYMEVSGVTSGTLAVGRYEVDRGRFISDLDISRGSQVVVLGSVPARQMFNGHTDPIGKIVTIGNEPFTVVGLMHDYVSMDGDYNVLERKNSVAFAPITTMQRRVSAQDTVDQISVRVDDASNLSKLVEEVEAILARSHRGINDFEVGTAQQSLEYVTSMRRNFFIVGCGVGAITLLVGGIGIMNLMLASINERVREIGIRKAIGAWNRDIFVQFIAEAIALSAVGGLFGVGVGVVCIRMLRRAMMGGNTAPPMLSITAILVGLAFSVVVGVIAGVYPAVRASRLDPIEALRYE